MAINGINGNNLGNVFNSIFGQNGSTEGSSAGGYTVSDYSMITNGSYKKLMKAYYAQEKEGSKDTSSSKDSESKVKLMNAKSQAASLNNGLEDLSKKSLYEATGTDENGKNTYDQDKIVSSVKDFVDDYNSYIKSAGKDMDSTALLKKAKNMVQATSKNAAMLSKIGITIGEDNQLKIDEDKLKNANVHDISSLFRDKGSYGDYIQNQARESYKVANSEANKGNGSSYTYSGGYATLGSANGALDRYL